MTFNLKNQGENADLRADVKFLMEQNSELLENMGRKPTTGNFEQPSETILPTINGQRIFLPDFSNLMASVSQTVKIMNW